MSASLIDHLRMEDSAAVLLAHLFNHQTHHRGQVHDLLMRTNVPPPSLDLHHVINPCTEQLAGYKG
jgi:uncharacterized damage-inducible protein DinB